MLAPAYLPLDTIQNHLIIVVGADFSAQEIPVATIQRLNPSNKMPKKPQLHLTRREGQAMDVVYRLGEASAAEVLERVDDPPSYSAIRSTLNILEEKGLVKHKMDGQRYVYYPVFEREKASRAALKRLLDTFFGGSPERAMATLLDMSSSRVSAGELQRLSNMIAHARKEGR